VPDRGVAGVDARGRYPGNRHRPPTAFCVLLAGRLVTALALACGWLGRARPRNVVPISVDTLGRGSLRPFRRDAAELPNLDGFAHRSVIFESALSPAAWTLSAHASLLTGVYPDRHGATDPRRRIAPKRPTLAQELRQAGLETGAFTDGGYVDRRFGFAAGFDRYDNWGRDPDRRPGLSVPRGGAPDPQPGSTLFDRPIDHLAQRHLGDPPFFLFLRTYAVHDHFRLERKVVRLLSAERFDGGKALPQIRRCGEPLRTLVSLAARLPYGVHERDAHTSDHCAVNH